MAVSQTGQSSSSARRPIPFQVVPLACIYLANVCNDILLCARVELPRSVGSCVSAASNTSVRVAKLSDTIITELTSLYFEWNLASLLIAKKNVVVLSVYLCKDYCVDFP